MTSKARFVLYLLPAVVSIANTLVIEVLRPACRSHRASAFVLGWLPNYLAGLGFVLLGLAVFRFVLEVSGEPGLQRYFHRWMLLVGAVSLLGLIGWELLQITGRLVFDPNDILASIAGVLTGYGLFVVAHRLRVVR